MDTRLDDIQIYANGHDNQPIFDQTPNFEEEKDNTPNDFVYVGTEGGIFDVVTTSEGIQGRELVMSELRVVSHINRNIQLDVYDQYKANLRQKYKISFLSLPILAFLFYYSLMQFVDAITLGSFYIHPLLSGGLIIASFFLMLVVIISAWQRDKLEYEIDQKIRALQ